MTKSMYFPAAPVVIHSIQIIIAFGKKEFAYAFVLQIGLSNCIFFVLLRLRGHTLLSSGGSGNLKLPFITW